MKGKEVKLYEVLSFLFMEKETTLLHFTPNAFLKQNKQKTKQKW